MIKLTPVETFFDLSTENRSGLPLVMALGHIRDVDSRRQLLIRLPEATNDRLAAAIVGPHGPAIVGILEWALDELNRQGRSLIICNKAATNAMSSAFRAQL